MTSNEDAVRNFRDGKGGNAKNVFREGKYLYSYGHHFKLAVKMRDGSYLINADTYSVSTSKQTSYCVRILNPHTAIPFSALANLTTQDFDDINIIDRLNDTYIPRTRIDPKTKELVEYSEHQMGASVFEFRGKHYLSSIDSESRGRGQGYFLVELPEKANNVVEAFEILRPKELAESTPYVRQGEFFFVPAPAIETKSLSKIPEQFKWGLYSPEYKMLIRETLRNTKEEAQTVLDRYNDGTFAFYPNRDYRHAPKDITLVIHRVPMPPNKNIAQFFPTAGTGNSHNAREIRLDKENNVYTRGRVRHPQHKDVNLGDVWHLVLCNRAVRSFNARGNVD